MMSAVKVSTSSLGNPMSDYENLAVGEHKAADKL
jgi:hypothetical protein